MILSGLEIKKRLLSDIIIEPFSDTQLNPNSYNLKLDSRLLVYQDGVLDMKKKLATQEVIIPESGLTLTPGVLYLGRTYEYTYTKNLVPMLEGRSSIGRLGLFIHITAGFGDVGFAGFWTLEMFCVQPITIYPMVEICQIFYHTIEGAFHPYESKKYQRNTGIQPSLLFQEFETESSL
jgi:dCTP deaminase